MSLVCQGKPCRKCGGTERRQGDCNRCVACQKARHAAWYQSHLDREREKSIQYGKAHPEKARIRQARYQRSHPLWDRLKLNPNARLAATLRSRLGVALRGNQKAGSAVRDLGCTIPELRAHLESKFQSGMTWENWSRDGWHIDHRTPLSKFDLTDRVQFLQACHYTNLQPLWAKDNYSKGARHG
jgi:hypothetical protein